MVALRTMSEPLFKTPPAALCILRLSAIGDVCHALSMVQQIHAHYPTTKLVWVIGKTERALFANVTNIHFVVYDKRSGLKGIRQLWRELRAFLAQENLNEFDALLDMQTALRASLLALGIPARYKIGFGKQRCREGQWLVVNRRVNDPADPHVLDGFLSFANAVGVPVDNSENAVRADLYLPDNLLKEMAAYLDPSRQSLLISPCSSKKEKDWLPAYYAQVANVANHAGKQVILTASPAPREQAMIKEILQHCDFQPLDLSGKTTLLQLAALIEQCDVLLSPDSGPAHIATLVGTPVIGLYAYHNPERTAPYCDKENVVSVYASALAADPKWGKKSPAERPWALKLRAPNLMAQITPDQVIEKMIAIGFLAQE